MKISELLEENGSSVHLLARHSHIPYSTLYDAFKKPYGTWTQKIFESTANELNLSMDDLAKNLSLLDTPLTPFIKWVGGKRQLLGNIDRILPRKYNNYFEPFLGGGALFLHLTPHTAVINDLNPELMNTWQVVKDDPESLMRLLKIHQEKNTKEYYLDIRLMDRDGRLKDMSSVERAARFIYLNKTGFNGLWRVNARGENNVPYGRYKRPVIADPRILSVSGYLNRNQITLLHTDYQEATKSVKKGDLVYFDPPYIPLTPTADFTSYTSSGFGIQEQQELRDTFAELSARGAFVILSNSNTKLTRQLYDSVPNRHFRQVKAGRSINSNAAKRGPITELIITNY